MVMSELGFDKALRRKFDATPKHIAEANAGKKESIVVTPAIR
jgi:hypothetical protein